MKTVFFDRDGIVNVAPPEGGYVCSVADFHLEPCFPDILRRIGRLGYTAVVLTNQRVVARGIVGIEVIDAIHVEMRRRLRDGYGLELLDVLCCPHGPGECACRKPLPGMFLEAARRHGIDLARSWMIGDRMTDVAAGRAAGCRTVLVSAAAGDAPAGADGGPDFACGDMRALSAHIEDWLGRTRSRPDREPETR